MRHVPPRLRVVLLLLALGCGKGPADDTGMGGVGGGGGAGGAAGEGGEDGGSAGGSGGAGDVAGMGGGAGGGGAAGAGGAGGSAGGAGGSAGGAGGSAGAGGGGAGGAGGSAAGTLRAAAETTQRLIGVAIGANHLGEAAYASTARTEFNYVTPENEMKWDATEPTRNTFRYTTADQVVTFAMQNGMKVKGHTLVWHSQLPTWASGLTTAADVRSAMVNHITQVMTHFKGKVVAWDVVNEAWNDNGASMRTSVFQRLLGNGFVDEAFMAARAADPDAKLYYNDYGTEGSSAKANAVYTMVMGMKARGIPIDGVGMQMHTGAANSGPSVAQFTTNMQRLAALGLEVVVSEMDAQICTSTVDVQRTRYHDIVAACRAQAACKAVTVWGVTDKYSWLNGQTTVPCATPRPLPFDDAYAKKPAYTGILDALLGR